MNLCEKKQIELDKMQYFLEVLKTLKIAAILEWVVT